MTPVLSRAVAPTLVDTAWLRGRIGEAATGDTSVRIVDLRWYLIGKRGADEYARGHIPGAVFVDLEGDLTPGSGPGRHPIPSAEQLSRAMRGAGVNEGDHVVVYDDAGGSIAARLWWLLKRHRHERVSVLDGGIDAWVGAGGALSSEAVRPYAGSFEAGLPSPAWPVVDKIAVRDRGAGVLVLDARALERYRGETEPVDARPGHIPGAKSAPWARNVESGRFLRGDALRAYYMNLGAGEASQIIAYCGSGVTACHTVLALDLAELPRAALYEGSWGDWAKDPTLPAAKGDE